MELDLVTGGAGFFGSFLVDKLRAAGRRVRIFDLRAPEAMHEDVELVRGDVRDFEAVARACEGVSTVHHDVALVPLAKNAKALWTVNRDGTHNVLRAACERGVRKVVYTSSSAVFGVPASNPVTDATPTRPLEAYGRAKLAGETLCREWAERGLDVSIVRPRTIMGPGRLGILQILFEWIVEGRNVPVLGRGDNLFQFVHADDLADACLRVAARSGPSVHNVGAEKFGTMRQTLEALVAHARTGSRVVSVPAAPAVVAMKLTSRLGLSPLAAYHALMYGRSFHFDLARTKRELGWSSRFDNVAMFCESYDWYVAHREEVLARTDASLHRSPVKQGILHVAQWALGFAPKRSDRHRSSTA